jgi:hypothetical protein
VLDISVKKGYNTIMKTKLLLALILAVTSAGTMAQWHHHGGYCCYRGGYGGGWIAPALVGGVIGYELSRPNTVYVEPAPVIVQPPVSVVQQPPVGYHWQQMIDPQTNTQKIVLVPNQ